MKRIIFHIDVNSAFLSWTAVELLKSGYETDLRTIPSIIGGNRETRHGVVLAKSVPAKQYGIRTGEPVVNAIRKCPNLVIESPDHHMYNRYSKKLMDFIHGYTPDIEQVSVDECYLDFTGIAHQYVSALEAAFEMKDKIYQEFGFTVNIGISNNKLLAKMASDFTKPNRVHTLFPEEIEVKMWPLPVCELYMAGKATVETLKKLEVNTIGDLARCHPDILKLHLKSHGKTLWDFANGRGESRLNQHVAEQKGIGNSTTLPKDVETLKEAQEILLGLSEKVAGRLRKIKQKAGVVSIEIRYSDFHNVSRQMTCKRPIQTASEIYQMASCLFIELWDKKPIRLLGIRTAKLVDETEPQQLDFMDVIKEEMPNEKHQKLEKALDEIKGKFGKDAVIRGSLLH